jgi:hypothetical protein
VLVVEYGNGATKRGGLRDTLSGGSYVEFVVAVDVRALLDSNEKRIVSKTLENYDQATTN